MDITTSDDGVYACVGKSIVEIVNERMNERTINMRVINETTYIFTIQLLFSSLG